MTKQSNWLWLSAELTREGRLDILRRYRVLRQTGIPRDVVRQVSRGLAHGVWMAKRGGW